MTEVALAALGQCDGVIAHASEDTGRHGLQVQLEERTVVTRRQRPVRLADVVVLVFGDVDVVQARRAGGSQTLSETVPVIFDRDTLAIDRDHPARYAAVRRGGAYLGVVRGECARRVILGPVETVSAVRIRRERSIE